MIRALLILIGVLVGSHFSPATAQQRIALLIGNQKYTAAVGPLKNPHHDVNLVGAALRKVGFRVRVLKDASYSEMDIAIKRHADRLRRAGKGAIGFFYFSGHGIANPDTRANYLVPTDVKAARGEEFWYAAFEQSLIIDRLRQRAGNATHYVVFDACRNELRIAGSAAKGIGDQKGFMPVTDTTGILIAYATAPRQTASDAGTGGGPYAKALAAELVRPGVEAVTMFRKVQLRVKRSIGQDPWLSIPTLPEVYLAGKATRPKVVPTNALATVASIASPLSRKHLLHQCLRDRPHFRAAQILARYKSRLTNQRHAFGWPRVVDRGAPLSVDDPRLSWHDITRVAINDGVLEIDYPWRGGRLRLVPVTSRRWGARSASAKYGAVAAGMQGLWATDDSYGCIELRFDDGGDARGEFGVHASKQLDTPVFLRAARPVKVAHHPPPPKRAQPVAAALPQAPLSLTRDDCRNLPLDQAVLCNLQLSAAARDHFLSSAQPGRQDHCDGVQVALADNSVGCIKAGRGKGFQECPECPEMVVVPAGSFIMGSLDGDYDERPRHKVVITKPFAVGKFEVTRDQWDACVAANGCQPRAARGTIGDFVALSGGRHPIVGISWHQARAYVAWLSAKTGQTYRLLTEAEWEYVARAGTTTRYDWGDDIGQDRANCWGCGSRWDKREAAFVGSFQASPWGLHELRGNVWEWVEDAWKPSYDAAQRAEAKRELARFRVMRGGAWNSIPDKLRAAARGKAAPTVRNAAVGFRVGRSIASP